MNKNAVATGWKLAYWTLFAGWIVGAALTMSRMRGGFLTSYLADLVFPPWYYIVMRGLSTGKQRVPRLLRWFGHSPERAAIAIFLVGTASELSQRCCHKVFSRALTIRGTLWLTLSGSASAMAAKNGKQAAPSNLTARVELALRSK
ncbi:hypothetical protein L0337_30495 [candidate division KSB1 bacterium]|nr:hypothetical protein [candidate division KSB1 bacterium]